MADKDSISKSDSILKRLSQYTTVNQDMFDDPTCIDGAVPDDDDDDEDEVIDLDWLLKAPTLIPVSEIIKCRKNKSWVNLVFQFIAEDSEDFEYEFEIVELEPEEVPPEAVILGNNN